MGVKMRARRKQKIKRYAWCYIMFLPVFLYLVVFKFYPLISQFVLASVDYNFGKGIFGSEFVGLYHYKQMFSSVDFLQVVYNTLAISFLKIVFGFFPPIILAIFLNDLWSSRFRRVSQTVVYLPYFLSWVIVYGISYAFISPGVGIINDWIVQLGGRPIDFLIDQSWFKPIIVITHMWKSTGWGTIIYLAALSGVDVELYEAANIDGANVWQRLLHITLPSIKPVVVFVLTLSLGNILAAGFEQVFLFQTTATLTVADTLETWAYRRGLVDMEYSFSSAVSVLQSVVGLGLVLLANKLSNKYAETGIW